MESSFITLGVIKISGNEELKREISLSGAVAIISGMTGPSVSLAFVLAELTIIFLREAYEGFKSLKSLFLD